jgi:hypothetical protein
MEATMGLAAAIRQWQSNWRRAHEFEGLGEEQREALARDIGVPEAVLAGLAARGPEAGAELSCLMETLSIDPERVPAALMRDMAITCSGCAVAARCRRDLKLGLARSAYGEYCPNGDMLRELQGALTA